MIVLCNNLQLVAINEKVSEEISIPERLNTDLAVQLRTCITALESKQSDTVIGWFDLLSHSFRITT